MELNLKTLNNLQFINNDTNQKGHDYHNSKDDWNHTRVTISCTSCNANKLPVLNIQYKDIQFIKVYWLCSKHQLVRLNSCFQTYRSFIQTERDPEDGGSAPFWIRRPPVSLTTSAQQKDLQNTHVSEKRSITNDQ